MTDTHNNVRASVVPTLACAFAAWYVVAKISDFDRGRAAFVFTAVLIIAASAHWKLRRRPLYWAALVLLAAGHVIAVIVHPWTEGGTSSAIIWVLAFLDGALDFAALGLTARFLRRDTKHAAV